MMYKVNRTKKKIKSISQHSAFCLVHELQKVKTNACTWLMFRHDISGWQVLMLMV